MLCRRTRGGFALDPPGLSPCASAEHRRLPEERRTHCGLEVESYLGVRVTKMLTDPYSLMMLAQSLPSNDVAVFRYDPPHTTETLPTLAAQFGQLCHLTFKMFYPSERIGAA